jgi:hypothetical protein
MMKPVIPREERPRDLPFAWFFVPATMTKPVIPREERLRDDDSSNPL